MMKSITKVAVVIPNLNGVNTLSECLESLLQQTMSGDIIVVENGSTDNSINLLKSYKSGITILKQQVNLGFAGGVNKGIMHAIDNGADFIILFNNDAIADKDFMKNLIKCINKDPKIGIVTSKILNSSGQTIDSTGDFYTNWGLPYPRGRNDSITNKYDLDTDVFAASGGASIYRVELFNQIGLFDEDFFAYYEDVDISFRAQLAGWKIKYEPTAIVYHQIGATSNTIHGFTTYQTMKNLPWLLVKNMPKKYFFSVLIRLYLANILFFIRAITRHQGRFALKGMVKSLLLMPKKIQERKTIQSLKLVSDEYIWSIITHDLPPNAQALKKIRNFKRFFKL